MIITSVRIKTLNTGNRMVALASITLDGMIAVHGVKILKSQEGYFLWQCLVEQSSQDSLRM